MYAFINRQVLPLAYQRFLQAHHASAAEQDGGDPFFHGGVEFRSCGHLLQKADAMRLAGIDDVAGVNQFGRLAPADQARQQHCFHTGRDAHTHLGHAEFCAVHTDAQIAGGCEFHAEAETPAVNACNHRHRKRTYRCIGHMGEGVFDLGLGSGEVFHFVDVGTCDERFVARTGNHRHAQLFVLCETIESVGNRAFACHAQRIAPLRIVDDQISDASCTATIIDARQQQIAHGKGRCIALAASCVTVGATSRYSARRVLLNSARIFSVHGVLRASCAAGLSHTSAPVSS